MLECEFPMVGNLRRLPWGAPRDPPTVKIDACGDATMWAQESFGYEPEAYCRRCRA